MRVFEEKGRVVNQKNLNESIREAQDRLAGFSNGPTGDSCPVERTNSIGRGCGQTGGLAGVKQKKMDEN